MIFIFIVVLEYGALRFSQCCKCDISNTQFGSCQFFARRAIRFNSRSFSRPEVIFFFLCLYSCCRTVRLLFVVLHRSRPASLLALLPPSHPFHPGVSVCRTRNRGLSVSFTDRPPGGAEGRAAEKKEVFMAGRESALRAEK